MPKYQVTVTYSITVDDAKDKNHAEFCALYDIGSNPFDYTNIEIKEVDTCIDNHEPNADIMAILEILAKFDKESEIEKEN